MNASIDAGDLAARNSARPAGKKSTTTFSPGSTPRCRSTSLRSVTCPFAVIVSVVPMGPRASIRREGKAMPPYIQVGVARSSRCQLNPADLVSAITGAQYVADGARTAADGAAHLGDPELSRAAEKRQPLYRSQSCTYIRH